MVTCTRLNIDATNVGIFGGGMKMEKVNWMHLHDAARILDGLEV